MVKSHPEIEQQDEEEGDREQIQKLNKDELQRKIE
jgi:hypothetical protein